MSPRPDPAGSERGGARRSVVVRRTPDKTIILAFGICLILSFQASVSPSSSDAASQVLADAILTDLGTHVIQSHCVPETSFCGEPIVFATVSVAQKFGVEPRPGWAEARKPKARRSRRDLHAAILRVSESNSVTANHLILRLNLNSKLASGCLTELLERGFIEARRGNKFATYSATQRGIIWLDIYVQLMKMENETSGTELMKHGFCRA